MKLFLHEDKSIKETIVDVTYRAYNSKVKNLVELIKENNIQLQGDKENKTYLLDSSEVYYIECVDNATFLYTELDVFENKQKLYNFKRKLSKSSFIQINKSTILNMNYLDNVQPLPNYRLEAQLENGDRLVINRHYMKDVKKYLNI